MNTGCCLVIPCCFSSDKRSRSDLSPSSTSVEPSPPPPLLSPLSLPSAIPSLSLSSRTSTPLPPEAPVVAFVAAQSSNRGTQTPRFGLFQVPVLLAKGKRKRKSPPPPPPPMPKSTSKGFNAIDWSQKVMMTPHLAPVVRHLDVHIYFLQSTI